MAILTLEDRKLGKITLAKVWREDLRRWLLAAATVIGVFLLAIWLVMQTGADFQKAIIVIGFERAEVPLALTLLAAIFVVGKVRDIKTFVVFVAGVLTWQLMAAGSILYLVFPIVTAGAACGVISALAIWRIVEYLDMVYFLKLENAPKFTKPVWAIYLILSVLPIMVVYF